MTAEVALIAVGSLGVLVVFGSRLIRHLPVTEPLLALLVGVALGPRALDLAEVPGGMTVLHTVSELVVAVALMAVALRFPWETVRRLGPAIVWMIGIGMVAMAAIVAALSSWILGVGLGTAVLLGGVLAPTDPVLSSNVVSGEPAEAALPERLRCMLSMEAGFNDGLALPIVVAGVVLVRGDGPGRFWIEGMAAVATGLVLGLLIGAVAGELFRRLDEAHGIEDSAFFVFTLVLSVFVLGVVNAVGGDGILAVVVSGLAYNRQVGTSIYEDEREVDEGVNRVLVLPLFILLGVLLPWDAWVSLGAPLVAFTVGVLVLRRLPVVALLAPALRLGARETAFYGWFGPMGGAALFFVTLAHEERATEPVVWPAVAMVVAASTVAHGVTCAPGRVLYQRRRSGSG